MVKAKTQGDGSSVFHLCSICVQVPGARYQISQLNPITFRAVDMFTQTVKNKYPTHLGITDSQ